MTVTISGTTGISGVDGSNTTPAVRGGTSSSNGVFYGTNTVSIATNGTTAVTVDSSQNVGIGDSSLGAYARLSIEKSGGDAAIRLKKTGGTALGYLAADGTNFWVGSDQGSTGKKFFVNLSAPDSSATIDSSGNLLVGTTSSSDSSGVGIKSIYSATQPGITVTGSGSTGSGTAGYNLYSTGAGAYRFYVTYAGVISATTTTISGISDQRLKENIRDLDIGLDAILSLKPRKFDWKAGKGKDIKNDRGFIAQEFEQIFPDLIDEWKDEPPEGEEPYKSVRQDLIPVLVKAIQELSAKNDALEARIAALEAN